jgi:hypothetical protein
MTGAGGVAIRSRKDAAGIAKQNANEPIRGGNGGVCNPAASLSVAARKEPLLLLRFVNVIHKRIPPRYGNDG